MRRNDPEPGSPGSWLRHARSDLRLAQRTGDRAILLESQTVFLNFTDRY